MRKHGGLPRLKLGHRGKAIPGASPARGVDVPVRPHLFAATGLLALAALLGFALVALPEPPPVQVPLLVGLLAATLLLQGIAYWYLPSFAKRAVRPQVLARAAPWIVVGAVAFLVAHAILLYAPLPPDEALVPLVATFGAATLGAALNLALFGAVLVLSVLTGPPWRGGTAFWRKEGEFRNGDRAAFAAFFLAAGCFVIAAALLAGNPLAPGDPGPLHAWLLALLLFTLGGLAHLLPRARGAALPARALLSGILVLAFSGLLLAFPFVPVPRARAVALFALALVGCIVALAWPTSGRGKPPGPRLVQARPLLLAGAGSLVLAAVALATDRDDLAPQAYLGLLSGLLLAIAGLSLLTLPVLANQRPAPRPALLAAFAGFLGVAVLFVPAVAILAGVLLPLAIALWIASLAPLRKPRRDCLPGEP